MPKGMKEQESVAWQISAAPWEPKELVSSPRSCPCMGWLTLQYQPLVTAPPLCAETILIPQPLKVLFVLLQNNPNFTLTMLWNLVCIFQCSVHKGEHICFPPTRRPACRTLKTLSSFTHSFIHSFIHSFCTDVLKL